MKNLLILLLSLVTCNAFAQPGKTKKGSKAHISITIDSAGNATVDSISLPPADTITIRDTVTLPAPPPLVVRDTVTVTDTVYLAQQSPPVTKPVTESLPIVRIDDYKLPGDSDYYNAWNKAKAALPNGGDIIFGEGDYEIKTGSSVAWLIEKNNLRLIGAGKEKTRLLAGGNLVVVSNNVRLTDGFVKGFRNSHVDYMFTYKNTTKKGDKFLILKEAGYADSIQIGQKLMLVAGSHYLDQEFGELITVTGKHNDTLFLRDPLSGEYAVEKSPFGTKTIADFIMPSIGETVSINCIYDYDGRPISVGDNVFAPIKSVKDSTGKSYNITLLNLGRGNDTAGTVIPIGSPIMKGRMVMLWNHTQNLEIRDLTIDGRDKQTHVLRLDNTYGALIKNVSVKRFSPAQLGCVFFTDFARDIKFEDCDFYAANYYGTQISRSAGDIGFKRCTFNNVSLDASEYSFNLRVDSCVFNIAIDKPIVLGATVRTSYITNNTFNVERCDWMIRAGELQNLNNVQREYSIIANNVINVSGYATAILDFPIYGDNHFVHNKVTGSGKVASLAISLNAVGNNGSGLYKTNNHVDSNYVKLYFSASPFGSGFWSGSIIGNYIGNLGDPTYTLCHSAKWKYANEVSIRDNIFEGLSGYGYSGTTPIITNNNTFSKIVSDK